MSVDYYLICESCEVHSTWIFDNKDNGKWQYPFVFRHLDCGPVRVVSEYDLAEREWDEDGHDDGEALGMSQAPGESAKAYAARVALKADI